MSPVQARPKSWKEKEASRLANKAIVHENALHLHPYLTIPRVGPHEKGEVYTVLRVHIHGFAGQDSLRNWRSESALFIGVVVKTPEGGAVLYRLPNLLYPALYDLSIKLTYGPFTFPLDIEVADRMGHLELIPRPAEPKQRGGGNQRG